MAGSGLKLEEVEPCRQRGLVDSDLRWAYPVVKRALAVGPRMSHRHGGSEIVGTR